jgi:hypothetical protein
MIQNRFDRRRIKSFMARKAAMKTILILDDELSLQGQHA